MICANLGCEEPADPYVNYDNSIVYYCEEHAEQLGLGKDYEEDEDPGTITD